MIRRDMRQADGAPAWMLISQIEHARISAELAARCVGRFRDSGGAAGVARAEVLAALQHHDDGWAEWECSPRLDPTEGRPLTFTELAPADAIAIWSRSIAVAEALGPLAAWMVAGHFLRLSRRAEPARSDAAILTWESQTALRRTAWLANWLQADSRRTPQLADAALEWLWTFDEVSLWLCCTWTPDDPIPCSETAYLAGRGTPLEMELRRGPAPGLAIVRPWQFADKCWNTVISGQVVPAAKYNNWAELLASASPAAVSWQLAGDVKLVETAPEPRS